MILTTLSEKPKTSTSTSRAAGHVAISGWERLAEGNNKILDQDAEFQSFT
jgi:hypothetical protein